ncbi:hypothetical protein TSAR_004648 [Trichomalopsis sarcophagae]|uniref:Uncharacterized protein n=1 Tax=Trichomalopsis sarcophagae TaxID=543379 RepID=A0A232EPY0_9HYME|nr:hypothetical protein TSAR_004648 [Trichomalopsis sarcophagae]
MMDVECNATCIIKIYKHFLHL